jgi:hypothetical protein
MSKPVLLYSLNCKYSTKLIHLLKDSPDLLNLFLLINIDVDQSGKRPDVFYRLYKAYNITQVPTLILEDGNVVLQGKDTLKWYDYIIKEQSQEKKTTDQLNGFNIDSTSNFSSLGENTSSLLTIPSDKVSSNTFFSLNNDEKPFTLWDGSENFTDHSNMNKTDINYEQSLEQKERERKELDLLFSQKKSV